MKVTHPKTNFAAGELSPFLYGRIDVQKYENGAKSIENYLVRPQGGLVRRPGTTYVKDAYDSTRKVRLHKFERSSTDFKVLEFGHLYVRIYAASDVILTTPYTESDLQDLWFEQSGDIVFIFHPSHAPRRLSRYSETTWDLTLYVTEDGPYRTKPSSLDGVTMTLSNLTDTLTLTSNTSLFVSGDASSTRYVEFVDKGRWRLGQIPTTGFVSATQVTVNYIPNVVDDASFETYVTGDGDIQPVSVLRHATGTVTSSTSDHITSFDVGRNVRADSAAETADPVYRWYPVKNIKTSTTVAVGTVLDTVNYTYPTTIVTPSNRLITATLTASSSVFSSGDVGRHVRLVYSGAVTWGIITAYSSTLQVTVELKSTAPVDPAKPTRLANGGTTADWLLGAFSTGTGWPRCGVIHGQRMWLAGSTEEPFTLWGSEIDDFYSYSTTTDISEVLDTSGMKLTLASSEANTIYWLSSGPTLLIGTDGSEWQLRPSNAVNEALTPTNFNLTRQTEVGSSSYTRPVRLGSETLFTQTSGSKMWSLGYDFNIDGYDAKDLTVLAEHILSDSGGVRQVALQKEPFPVIWCVMSNGTLTALTHEKRQEVTAWTRHVVGGSGVVESITVPNYQDGSGQQPYVAVKRVVDGVTYRTVERFGHVGSTTEPYADCCQEFTPSGGLTITGASRFTGSTPVIVDGDFVETVTVTSGSATLQNSQTAVCLGYSYDSWVTPLPLDIALRDGTTVGSSRTPVKVTARLHNTNTLAHRSTHTGDYVITTEVIDGFASFHPDNESSRGATVTLGCNQPRHSALISLVLSVSVGENL